MERLATFASVIGLGAAIFAYSVTHWGFPQVGFEGALFYGGVSFWLGAMAAGLAVLICVARLLLKRPRLRWQLLGAIAAIAVLIATAGFA